MFSITKFVKIAEITLNIFCQARLTQQTSNLTEMLLGS